MTIQIKDLTVSKELDVSEMSAVRGGEDRICDSGCGNGSKADANPANGTDNSGDPKWTGLLFGLCAWVYTNIPGL